MKRLIAPTVILSIGLCCFTYVRAQNYDLADILQNYEPSDILLLGGYSTGLEGVDGVNGVAVVVVPALTAAGVQSDFVKDLVHLRLRREGIRVSPQDPESDQPTLDVTVGGMQMVNSLGVPFDGYSCYVAMSVVQPCTTVRTVGGQPLRVLATTYSQSRPFIAPQAQISALLRETTNSLADDILSTPKRKC